MKFTLSWLKDHLDTNATLEEITAQLTALGLEVDSVEDKAKLYAPFTVAYVEKAEAPRCRPAESLHGRYGQGQGECCMWRAQCAGRDEGYFRARRQLYSWP